jgi:hypothetical protein
MEVLGSNLGTFGAPSKGAGTEKPFQEFPSLPLNVQIHFQAGKRGVGLGKRLRNPDFRILSKRKSKE